jgi:hypothetical protein
MRLKKEELPNCLDRIAPNLGALVCRSIDRYEVQFFKRDLFLIHAY